MRSDEEQQEYEKLQTEVTRLQSEEPREEEEIEEGEGFVEVKPEEVEEIMFGEEEIKPYEEQSLHKGPKQMIGPSGEKDIHVRVSDSDFYLLRNVPGMKANPSTSAFLRAISKGIEKDRNDVWVSERQLEETISALTQYAQSERVGLDERTHAQDLAARYERLARPPKAKRRDVPTYKEAPRGPGNVRMFSYRGAKIQRRKRL